MERTRRAVVCTRLLLTWISACSDPFDLTQGTSSNSAADAGTIAPPTAADVPCQVADVLQRKCQSCHGVVPSNGAPMSLVTWSDLHAPARSDAGHAVYELALLRMRDRARPMPPDPSQQVDDVDYRILLDWAHAGAQSGPSCMQLRQAAGTTAAASAGVAGVRGAAGLGGSSAASAGTAAGASGNTANAEELPAMPAGNGASARSAATPGSGGATSPAAGSGAMLDVMTGQNQAGAPLPPSNTAPDMPVIPSDAGTEQCYELHAHGRAGPTDTTPYTVPPGETYTSFIFKTPWTQPVQGVRFRHLPDDAAVLHHWILYTESAPAPDGDIQACALSGLLGFLCGAGTTRSMITGWAPGRGDFALPDDVGLELPRPGSLLALEVHYFNFDTASALDHSGIEVCVTSQFRLHTASVSWLGTESIRVPPHAVGMASGTCTPRRSGLGSNDPIHVLYSWPHMHKLGRHLTTLVQRNTGTQDTLYDGDFSFDYQVLHDTPLILQSGDTLTTRCSYENTTDTEVRFGQSTREEMCFNFVYAWPAHALDNPDGALGEAGNTCLH